ncbi:flagellar associated protein, partial [Haematococcus lacustris]
MLSHDRTLGGTMTTHNLTYTPPEQFVKPEHAKKPLIRETFYRRTNILFPSSCSADPDA